jgi:hypothetical protein
MGRPEGGDSIPPPERGRVGVRRSVLPFARHRGRKLTPTRLAPIKSGLADLPLSGGGMTEVLYR